MIEEPQTTQQHKNERFYVNNRLGMGSAAERMGSLYTESLPTYRKRVSPVWKSRPWRTECDRVSGL
jgi:hypothetical protein